MISTIDTRKGEKLDLADPSAGQIHIQDVALALSRICRFAGHSVEFYSVAQHSLLVADIVEALGYPELCPLALHHDSHEAFMGDISSPLKKLLEDRGQISELRALSGRLDRAIRAAFGIGDPTPDQRAIVKKADLMALRIEARAIMQTTFVTPPITGLSEVSKLPKLSRCLDSRSAYDLFLERHRELGLPWN